MFHIYLHSLTPAGQSQKLKKCLTLDYTAFFKPNSSNQIYAHPSIDFI